MWASACGTSPAPAAGSSALRLRGAAERGERRSLLLSARGRSEAERRGRQAGSPCEPHGPSDCEKGRRSRPAARRPGMVRRRRLPWAQLGLRSAPARRALPSSARSLPPSLPFPCSFPCRRRRPPITSSPGSRSHVSDPLPGVGRAGGRKRRGLLRRALCGAGRGGQARRGGRSPPSLGGGRRAPTDPRRPRRGLLPARAEAPRGRAWRAVGGRGPRPRGSRAGGLRVNGKLGFPGMRGMEALQGGGLPRPPSGLAAAGSSPSISEGKGARGRGRHGAFSEVLHRKWPSDLPSPPPAPIFSLYLLCGPALRCGLEVWVCVCRCRAVLLGPIALTFPWGGVVHSCGELPAADSPLPPHTPPPGEVLQSLKRSCRLLGLFLWILCRTQNSIGAREHAVCCVFYWQKGTDAGCTLLRFPPAPGKGFNHFFLCFIFLPSHPLQELIPALLLFVVFVPPGGMYILKYS